MKKIYFLNRIGSYREHIIWGGGSAILAMDSCQEIQAQILLIVLAIPSLPLVKSLIFLQKLSDFSQYSYSVGKLGRVGQPSIGTEHL